MQSSFGKPSLLLVFLWLTAQEIVIWGWSMRWLINWFEGMKLEILERSGHIEGWQPTSLTPQHARICSSCSQGSVTEHNSHTWHKKEKVCHILASEPQKSGQRERRDLCHDPSRTACHTQEIPTPFMDFPCPLTLTNKAVCTQIPHEREGVKLISTSQEMVLLVGFIQPLKFVPKETSATFRSFYSFLFKFQVESFNITYWWVWG